MSKRCLITLFALYLALICAIGARPTPAYAHAIMLRSDPPDGAVLAAAPQQVRLWLSEPVALNFTTVALDDSAGRRIAVAAHSDAASLAVAVRSAGASTTLLLIDLPALPPSAYRLSWRALSSGDLHVTSGSIIFGVQRAANLALVAAAARLPPPVEVLLRWLNFGALATLIGALALALLVLPRTVDAVSYATLEPAANEVAAALITGIRCRLFALARWSATLAIIAGFGLLLVQTLDAGAPTGQNVLASARILVGGTSYGQYWLLRQFLLLMLFITLTISLRRSDRTRSLFFSILNAQCSMLLVIAQALSSHATAFTSFSPLRVLVEALHLLAACLWVGGLLALALAILPLLRGGYAERALAWSALRRFGGLATTSLVALLITGLLVTGQQIASLDALLTTLYGQTLLLKIVLALGTTLIGLLNATALHPRIAQVLRWVAAALAPALPRHPSPVAAGERNIWLPSPVATGEGLEVRVLLARTVLLEAIGATLVLLLAALLSATAPARGPAFDPPAEESAPPTITTRADDLVISLSVKPNRPGQNFLSLGVFETRRPSPAPINQVRVRLHGPGERETDALLSAESLGGGRYQIAGDVIDTAGDWSITVSVSRQGLPATQASISWIVMPQMQTTEARPVWISNQPLAPMLTLAALLTTLALLGAGALFWRRWQQPEDRWHPPLRRPIQPTSIEEKRARP